MPAMQILVSGVVQGVGYRAWCRRAAKALGLHGFVRNLDDGRVEAVVQGDARAIDALAVQCWQGPDHAEVRDVTQRAMGARNATDVVIAADASAPERNPR